MFLIGASHRSRRPAVDGCVLEAPRKGRAYTHTFWKVVVVLERRAPACCFSQIISLFSSRPSPFLHPVSPLTLPTTYVCAA